MMVSAFALVLCVGAAPLDVVKSITSERQAAKTPEQLAAALEKRIDFTELARRSLGDEWTHLSKPQQAELVATLKGLLKANWLQKLTNDDASGNGTLFGTEKVSGDDAQVETVVQLAGDPLPVDYRLHRDKAGSWKIYDVVTDGASVVELYQAEFKKQISKQGYDGLLRTLKDKVAMLEKRR